MEQKRMTVKDVPPGKLFRLARTGTLYMKMPDGSHRNITKAMKRNPNLAAMLTEQMKKLSEATRKAGEQIKDTAAKIKEQETTSDQ